MSKQTHDLQQGTQPWHQFRSTHFGASEASAMLDINPWQSRNDLLKLKITGLSPEVDKHTQRVFDKGHETEALARPILEAVLAEDLYPATYSKGKLSASVDGITIGEDIVFEHKQYSEKLFSSVSNNEVPAYYMAQCQQILHVTDAEKVIFVCSNGTEETFASTEVYPDKEWIERIINGWSQFETDLENYAPVVHDTKPEADAIKELPTLFVQAYGEITNNNMEDFGKALAKSLADSRAIVLVTDKDFANANKAAKTYRAQIEKLELVKKAMLEQTTSIGDAVRMIDDWKEDLRVTALQLEKDVKREDAAKKESIINGAKLAFETHLSSLANEVSPIRLNIEKPVFANAIAKKRDYNSMQNAVDTMLANAKIEADAIAKDVREKLAYYNDTAVDHKFLFSDLQNMIAFEKSHFEMAVRVRIETHKKAEADKLEQQRLKIEADAKAKAEREQAQKLESEREKIRLEEQAKIAEENRVKAEQIKLSEAEIKKFNDSLQESQNEPVTVDELRQSALDCRERAAHADKSSYASEDYNQAAYYDRQANKLESAQKTTLELTEEVESIITESIKHTKTDRERIIWAVVGEFDISFNDAEKLILSVFEVENA